MTLDGRRRVIIEGVEPEIDGGRFPAKRVVGDRVVIEADIFADGHDLITAELLFRKQGAEEWNIAPMSPLVNDRWRGEFYVTELGRYEFTLRAWIDHFATWRRDLRKRIDAADDISTQLLIGAGMLEEAAARNPAARDELSALGGRLRDPQQSSGAVNRLMAGDIGELVASVPDRSLATEYGKHLEILVEVPKARFSAWYELFPRSMGKAHSHGTLRDVIRKLPYVAEMGFDILYMPPIHPIGASFRKGKNNSVTALEGEPGSPWAVGGVAGGHTAIHPDLGTLEDFDALVAEAKKRNIDIALDIAFQAAPDHPLVKEHPEFFLWRPDGTVQYAENPPKKYQDIYPFHFETEAWQQLWEELRDIFAFWVERGVKVFRVDNPHTKPLPFWEWTLTELKRLYPDVIFLSEAFTRPKVMYYLAKAGFSQSYTYFTWRNTKQELTSYFTELTKSKVRDFFRPNAWPNTPDILPEFLQSGSKAAFQLRLVLAATLCSNYGIYGPAYELMEHKPRAFGAEEYLDSEKYEIKDWNFDDPQSLRYFIARVNQIRRENAALHRNDTLRFHPVSNEQLICYSKSSEDGENVIVVVANLDPFQQHAGTVSLDLEGVDTDSAFQVHDLLGGQRFLWRTGENYVQLNPGVTPAHIFRIRKRLRTERDFDYYF